MSGHSIPPHFRGNTVRGSSHPRRRDQIRDLFRRSKSPQPDVRETVQSVPHVLPQSSSTATASPSQPAVLLGPGQGFLEAALVKLSLQQRKIIETHLLADAQDVASAVEKSHDDISRHRDICESKKWHFNVNGKQIVLRDVADTVLRWLDRFKSIGDIAVNADPIHAGLPWAGIRFLLEIAMLERHQMATLLTGMSLALRMTNRLQAYFEYYQRLPPKPVTEVFRKGLVEFYAHILGFIATAIDTGRRSTASRMWNAIWDTSTLNDFEGECDRLGSRLDIDANNCDRDLTADDRGYEKQWRVDLSSKLQGIRDIEKIVQALNVKFDLKELKVAAGATYNSYDDGYAAYCLAGTRTDLLKRIALWVDDPKGKSIFWLCGMAGTGKSTISRTVAHDLDTKQRLAASFFFKRGEGDRGSAKLFFPTIVRQLLDKIPGPRELVAQALEADSFLCDQNLQSQFEKLLENPLNNALPRKNSKQCLFVVVDALDECERKEDVRMILKLLARVETISSLRLRVLVTSRPHIPIDIGFQEIGGDLHQDVILEQVQASTIEQDIRAFFEQKFLDIKSDRLREQPTNPLPQDWPSEADMQMLVDLAVPLFIFASTISTFISERAPQKRLDLILKQQERQAFSGLGKTYLPILEQLVADKDEDSQYEIVEEFRELVGPIVLVAEPLSVLSLSSLLELDQGDISDYLRHLHSVLSVPRDLHQPVRLLHLSFRDFLVDPARRDRERFWIDEVQTHRKLTTQCLKLLGGRDVLHRDICGLMRPGTRRSDVDSQLFTSRIPPDVAYACLYWVYHTIESRQDVLDEGHVHGFLNLHFIHWLEALSWLGRLSRAVGMIDELRFRAQSTHATRVAELLDDARRFLLQNLRMIDNAPLQIYHSALEFTPIRSIMRKLFVNDSNQYFSLHPALPLDWNPEVLKLEGHLGYVDAVAFSPNGELLASMSNHGRIQVWSARTGEEKQRSTAPHVPRHVTFTQDEQVLALAPNRNDAMSVQVWNMETGELSTKFEDDKHCHRITVVSPNGRLIAAALMYEIHLIDAKSSKRIEVFKEYSSLVTALRFSLDSQTLALGFADGTLLLQDTRQGTRLDKIRGHEDRIYDVSFLPSEDNTMISASADKTVRLWNTTTGEQRQFPMSFNFPFETAVFSPQGHMIVFASDDQTVRLWDIPKGRQALELKDCEWRQLDKRPLIAFELTEPVVAVAKRNRTVELWNMGTGEQIWASQGHSDRITAIAMSEDGLVVASSSLDWTLRLWDASTGHERKTIDAAHPASRNSLPTCPHKSILISPCGGLIAADYLDHNTRLWNMETGECIPDIYGDLVHLGKYGVLSDATLVITRLKSRLNQYIARTGKLTSTTSYFIDSDIEIATSLDGHFIAVGTYSGKVNIWNFETGDLMPELQGHMNTISRLTLSPNGQFVALASGDGEVRVFATRTGKAMLKLERPVDGRRDIDAVAFSLDGHILAVSFAFTVQLWSIREGKKTQQVEVDRGRALAMAFQPGTDIMAISAGRTVQLWDTQEGQIVQLLAGHTALVKAIVFSPDGKLIASISLDNTVRLWNAQVDKQVPKLKARDDDTRAISISPKGHVIASACGNDIQLWDSHTGEERRLQGHRELVTKFVFSPDGSMLASISREDTIRLWGIQKQTQFKVPKEHRGYNVAFSQNRMIVVYKSSQETKSRIWSVQSGLQLREINLSGSVSLYIDSLALSWNGHYLTLAYRKANVRSCQCLSLWDMEEGRNILTFSLTDRQMWADTKPVVVKFSPNNLFVVLALYDRLELWSTQTGERSQLLEWPFGAQKFIITAGAFGQLQSITFSREGDTEFIRSFAGTVVLKWTSSGKLVEPLERTTGLELASQWIRHRGQDLIYLPYDRIGLCFAIHGNLLVMGNFSGGVDFYRLKTDDSDNAVLEEPKGLSEESSEESSGGPSEE